MIYGAYNRVTEKFYQLAAEVNVPRTVTVADTVIS
jgi:hypothetical protein